jgi:hypothetical protein
MKHLAGAPPTANATPITIQPSISVLQTVANALVQAMNKNNKNTARVSIRKRLETAFSVARQDTLRQTVHSSREIMEAITSLVGTTQDGTTWRNGRQQAPVSGEDGQWQEVLLVWNVPTIVNDTFNGDTHQAIRTKSLSKLGSDFRQLCMVCTVPHVNSTPPRTHR